MASDPTILQGKVDTLELDMDAFKAWLTDTVGIDIVVPEGPTIPSLLKIINQILAVVPVKGYLTQAALLADLTPGPQTVAFAADTQNQYVKSGASGTGSWTAAGTSQIAGILARLTSAENSITALNALMATISGILRLPTGADFVAKTGYTKAHSNGSGYAGNVVETEDVNGFTAAAGAGLGAQYLTGIRLGYDMVPGDVFILEGRITSGSPGNNIGPFIGTDTNTSGDFLAGAVNATIWRMAAAGSGLWGSNSVGGGNATYDPTPASTGGTATIATNDLLRLECRVRNGRKLNLRGYKNGTKLFDVMQNTAFPAGRVVAGFSLAPSITVRITKFQKSGFTGDIIYIDGTVAADGNGSAFAPYKTCAAAVAGCALYGFNRFKGFLLGDCSGDALVPDSSIYPEWELYSHPWMKRIDAAETSPTDYSVVAGTTDVYTRPNKNLAGAANTGSAGYPYLIGIPKNPVTATWYTLPNTYLPFTTAAPVDIQAITTGAWRVTGGQHYLRLPDSLPSKNPAVANIKVNVSEAALYMKGNPKVRCDNIIFGYGGDQAVYLDSGTLYLNNCGVEFAGSNGIQTKYGNLYMKGGYVKYVDNDCINRSVDTTGVLPIDTPWKTFCEDVELAYTAQGDGQSDHGLDAFGTRSVAFFARCRIHDCNKDGIVPGSCDVYIDNCDIWNCANAQVEVIAGLTVDFPAGMKAKMVVNNSRLDPRGNGLYGVLISGYAGGLIDFTLEGGSWIGTPKASGGREIMVAVPLAVSGRTHLQTDWKLRLYKDCGTERPAGTRLIQDTGNNATITYVEFNGL